MMRLGPLSAAVSSFSLLVHVQPSPVGLLIVPQVSSNLSMSISILTSRGLAVELVLSLFEVRVMEVGKIGRVS